MSEDGLKGVDTHLKLMMGGETGWGNFVPILSQGMLGGVENHLKLGQGRGNWDGTVL